MKEGWNQLLTKERMILILYGVLGVLLGIVCSSILKPTICDILEQTFGECRTVYFYCALIVLIFEFLFFCFSFLSILLQHEIRNKSNLSRKERGIALLYGIVLVLLILPDKFKINFYSILFYYDCGIYFVGILSLLYTVGCGLIAAYKQRKLAHGAYAEICLYVGLSIILGGIYLLCIGKRSLSSFISFYVLLNIAYFSPLFDFFEYIEVEHKERVIEKK